MRWAVSLCGALWLAAASAALAQQKEPHIRYVYPAGGRQGTTFTATIGGQYLNNASNVYVSGTGIHVTMIEHERQLTPQEQNALKEKLAKLQEKRKQGQRLTPEEAKSAEEIKKVLNGFGRRPENPALGEFVILQVTLAANAEPGTREIRLGTPAGLSNPMAFLVGQLPEFSKPDWKNIPKSKGSMEPERAAQPTEANVTLPATLNGQIPPGGVDRYRFQARQGQHVVVALRARELIPYIADAVPGWFQATLTLDDAQGKEVAYDDDYRFHPDPVLFYTIPKDGAYVVEIKDALYRGREDFVYRIDIGELPFVTGIFPLGGRAGAPTTVAVRGWNLPIDKQTLEPKAPGLFPFGVRNADRVSNHVPFAVDTLPECFEIEPNNAPTNAQAVTLPVIVNGRIDPPGDVDVFRFEGRAGDRVVAEILARRLDSPLDSVLKLTDAAGRQLAFNDDHEDKGSGLNTHHADSYLSATLSTNGPCYLHVWDAQHKGGWAYGYRLRISAPQPDFALRVAPSSLNGRPGANVPLTVYALRKDGFSGEIALALKDAPADFKLTAAQVPANQDQVKLTLRVPANPSAAPIDLQLEGRATIEGRAIVRPAVPADDMTQAFAYRHLVPANDLKAIVLDRPAPRAAAQILTATPIKLPAGGSARVHVFMPMGPLVSNVEYRLDGPPEGIAITRVSSLERGVEIVLQTEGAKVAAGQKGNLIVNVFGERPLPGERPAAAKRSILLGTLPAMPFEIVQP